MPQVGLYKVNTNFYQPEVRFPGLRKKALKNSWNGALSNG